MSEANIGLVIARRPKADVAIQSRRALYVPLDCFVAIARR
jgi:hypothetical protein